MGKGDIKSKRGKILNKSYGVRRKQRKANRFLKLRKTKNNSIAFVY